MIMTEEHERWKEFRERLAKALSFNQQIPGDKKSITWNCDNKFTWAIIIINNMGCDVIKTLRYFMDHGAYCDCDILFNVGYNTGGNNDGT